MVAGVLVVGSLFLRAGVIRATDDASPTPTPTPTSTPTPTPTPTPNSNVTPPSFPRCIDQSGTGDKAHYDNGLHQIVGNGLLEGKDDVYTLSNGNYLQCFVPPAKDVCIQTDWWRTDEELQGWYSVNGSQWDLGNFHYLAKNLNYDCTPPSPTPSPTPNPTPSPTPSPVVIVVNNDNHNENHQEQTQTQNNNQTVNVTTGQVLGATTVPTRAPETGVGMLGMTGMFGAGPIGFVLSKFGKGKFSSKRKEDINEIAMGIITNRQGKINQD